MGCSMGGAWNGDGASSEGYVMAECELYPMLSRWCVYTVRAVSICSPSRVMAAKTVGAPLAVRAASEFGARGRERKADGHNDGCVDDEDAEDGDFALVVTVVVTVVATVVRWSMVWSALPRGVPCASPTGARPCS